LPSACQGGNSHVPWNAAASVERLLRRLFLLSVLGQSVAGLADYNEEQISHGQRPVTYGDFVTSSNFVVVQNEEQSEHGQATIDWISYIASPDFWDRTLQNWQLEFLAVGSMVAFSIYLRQRGSSESKPVGTPHYETATEGE
jgi:hypothetical protein